jgi:hypothetical protein
VNSKERNFSKAKLRARIDRLETHIEEYLKENEGTDGKENTGKEKTAADAGNKLVAEFGVVFNP